MCLPGAHGAAVGGGAMQVCWLFLWEAARAAHGAIDVAQSATWCERGLHCRAGMVAALPRRYGSAGLWRGCGRKRCTQRDPQHSSPYTRCADAPSA